MHVRTTRLDLPFSLLAAALLAVGCPGDPEPGEETGSTPTSSTTEPTGGSTGEGSTSAATAGGSTGTGTGTDTSSALDCDDATDEASCAAAMNDAEGGGCTWMVIHDLSIDDAGVCTFTDSGTGDCVGTDGLDDGCNEGFVCDDGREVYFRAAGDSWQMAQGRACRGVSGFELCETTDDEPCTCACDLP